MRTSPAKLLLLIAFALVFVVEGRTVLAFFDVEVTLTQSLVVAVLIVGVILLWAFRPADDEGTGS